MSATLCWEPIGARRNLGRAARQALERYFAPNRMGDQRHRLSKHDESLMGFLRGYAASSDYNEDAQALIDAIETHGEIDVWLEH